MTTLLFFERESEPPTSMADLEDALACLPHLHWEAPAGQAYRPACFHDPATGARAAWDVGQPPLDASEPTGDDHAIRSYSGWRAVPLSLQVPLVGPHWQAVTALAQVDRLLAIAPQLHALDCEDTIFDDDSDSGPFPWDRPRVIANWEKQRADHIAELSVPRLNRAASVLLWRYRVERAAGRRTFPEHHWPDGLALHDLATGEVRTACLWGEPSAPLALPPVDVVVLRGGVIPSDSLRRLGSATGPGAAILIEPNQAVLDLHAHVEPLAASRFRGLGDEDWCD